VVKNDRASYYEYLAIQVDDTLCISENPVTLMTSISKMYQIKYNSIENPKLYLGAQVVKYALTNKTKLHWGMSSKNHIGKAMKNIE